MLLKEETLNKNLTALEKYNPQLVQWIKEEPDKDWIEVIQNKVDSTSQPNLLITSGSKKLPAYSTDKNPITELRKNIKKEMLFKENSTVQLGIGLGYLLKAYLEKLEKGHRIIVVEPIAHMFRLAFSHYDFTNAINEHTLILPFPEELSVSIILSSINDCCVITQWCVTAEEYTIHRYDEYYEWSQFIVKHINQMRCNTGTVMGAGHVIADNDIASLPYVIRHRGVNELKDLFKDKPAIMISTGPSLAKNIHKVKEYQDKAVIIAVAQALRPLLAYDIHPDFICTVDFGEVNMGHLKGLMDSDVPLVTLNRTYAPLVEAWKGNKFICTTPVANPENIACGILQNQGWVDQGGSVSHMCLGLAWLMGCNPIIMIGQDLSIGDTSHFMQVDAAGTTTIDSGGLISWKVTDPRCELLTKEESITMGVPVKVPGYFGNYVITNIGLASFIQAFESLINQYQKINPNIKIINATEGGAKIKGAIQLPFDRTINKFCQTRIDKSILIPLLSFSPDADERIQKIIPLLHRDMEILDTVEKESAAGLENDEEMKKCKEDHKKLKELFVENAKHSSAAYQASLKNDLIMVAIFNASRQIHGRELKKAKEDVKSLLKNEKDLMIRIERNEIILKAAQKAAQDLKKSYTKATEILEAYQKDKSILTPPDEPPVNFDDVEKYFVAGNWAHPLLDALRVINYSINDGCRTINPIYSKEQTEKAREIEEKALKMKEEAIAKAKEWNSDEGYKLIQYNKLIEKARKIGREEKKFNKSLRLLLKAIKLCPNSIEAQWGIATTFHHIGQFNRSVKEYEKLIEIEPNNLKFKYEMGNVLLKTSKFNHGMKIIKEVMEKTHEFDSFFQRIGDICIETKKYDEALLAYQSYLDNFPHDYQVWIKKADCLDLLNRQQEAEESRQKAFGLKPELKNKSN